MFVLAELEDVVRVAPDRFGNVEQCILDELTRKYARHVLNDVGLCVAVHDLLDVGEGVVPHNEGAAFYKVRFRMATFRPAVGEVLVGRVCASSPTEGVQVSLGFTSAVVIPPLALPRPSQFDEAEGMWLWDYRGHSLYFEHNQEIRFRVEELRFHPPPRPQPPQLQQQSQQKTVSLAEQPMLIVGQASEAGLGMLSWWQQEDE